MDRLSDSPLLDARYVTFSAVAVLLLVLAVGGQRVGYEQSINSFFAEDDPYMAVYQQAAKTFGDDNFVFVVYDDPDLLTPAGLDRVSELAGAVAPEKSRACSGSSRWTRCRCSGRSTTPCSPWIACRRWRETWP